MFWESSGVVGFDLGPLLEGQMRTAAAARREIFGINALRGKQQQLGSPNLQDIFIGG